MSLKHAILAVLSHADRTGYELTRKIDGSVANFWPATHQQIYLELKKLNDLGYVYFREEEQEGKPNKKVYSISQPGIEELRSWIDKPTAPSPSKDILLVKLFASHLVDKDQLAEELLRHREAHQAKYEEYLEIEKAFFSQKKLPPNLLGQYLTLRNGILFEEAWLVWCQECFKAFKIKETAKSNQ